jgi:hypothetical protein
LIGRIESGNSLSQEETEFCRRAGGETPPLRVLRLPKNVKVIP